MDGGLVVRSARAWYGQAQVLFGVDLEVRRREIVGLFGHNGAGKSTLFRVIAGLHRHAKWTATLDGQPLDGRRPHQISRSGVVLVREGARIFDGLTVEEHVFLGYRLAKLGGRVPNELETVYTAFPLLEAHRHQAATRLSGGQRQLVCLAMAFAANPVCLLLDEPSTGLAVATLEALAEALRTMTARGVSMLIAEQNPTWLATMAERAYLLSLGRITAAGRPYEVLGVDGDGRGDA